jgi:DNA-binding protein WhiA
LLRGAFLSCGAVTNPEKDYHLEFSVPYYNLSRDLLALLGEEGFPAKMVSRNGSYIVYIKESERIEDCLTYLGASRGALEMMSVKMVKSIRNETNRRLNCENANIDKTIAAAGAHADAIRRIRAAGALDSLSPELRQLALLREENPDMSLRELGAALDPPLSRSGVNHRLQRLLTIADELSNK